MEKGKINTLLVEDNPADVILLREALENDTLTAFELTPVERLSAALELLNNHSFDIILLDLGLPDSLGLATFVRVHQVAPDLPIVILSGQSDEVLALQAVNTGAQDYLVKGAVGFAAAARAIRYAIERQQAQKALRKSEARLKGFLNSAPDGIVIVDQTGRIILTNARMEKLFGYTQAELWGQNIEILIPKRVRIQHRGHLANFFSSPRHRAIDTNTNLFALRKDGTEFPVEISLSQHNIEGEITVISAIREISKRRQAEISLAEVSQKNQDAMDASKSAYWEYDPHREVFIFNERFYQLHGITDAPGFEMSAAEFTHRYVHPNYEPQVAGVIRRAKETADPHARISIDGLLVRTDGEQFWVNTTVWVEKDTAGKTTRLRGVNQNITQRKLAEEALRQSEKKIRLITETISEVFWMADPEINRTLYISPAYERVWGRTQESLYAEPRSFIEAIHPEDREKVLSTLALQQKGVPFNHQYRIIRPDGSLRWVWDQGYPVEDETGAVKMYVGVAQDITERKHAEDALRQSEEKYRGLMESIDSVVVTVDDQGHILYMNELGAAQLGSTSSELIGKSLGQLFPEPFATEQMNNIRQVIREDKALVYESPNWVRGQLRWYRVSVQPIHNETGRVIYALVNATDIHNLKVFQQELQELNRTLEERVTQRTAEVQDLYERAPIGYHSLDAGGKFVMVNQTELTWLGYTSAEMIGRPVQEFLTPPSFAAFRENFPVFKQRGWLKDLELEFIRQDGSILPTLVSATAIYDDAGNFVMSRSTVADLTERKKAEAALRESEEQNRLLFEEAPDAVVLFDEAGRIVQTNHAFEILTGYSREQLAFQTFSNIGLLSQEQINLLSAAVVQALHLTDSFASAEFKLNRANAETRDVGVRVFGLKIRGRQHYLTTMRDITIEKQVEETLRRANAELSQAARAKDEFLANMSHELRTPLNAILNFSESLLEEVRGPLNERQQLAVRHIETSGRHLLGLINDILDLSKVEAGQMNLQFQTVSIADICQASLLFVKETAARRQLNLTFHLTDQTVKMETDAKRLKQMLVNLLSNAVKFTPDGGHISLEVTFDPAREVVRFAVQDTGIGIPPGNLAQLFQPFTQLDSSLSRQYEGTGLGLALVRRLAELHGGSVTVESVEGQGSRFTIALPYRVTAKAKPATGPLSGRKIDPHRRLSALVVEDSESTAEQLARYLQEMQVYVTIHPQGQGVLEQASLLQPDLIFLDLLLPNQSGWDVLAQLKADSRTRDIPVIIISVVDERAKGLAKGAAEYLVKPISREMLRQVLTAGAAPESLAESPATDSLPSRPLGDGARVLLVEDSEVNLVTIGDYLRYKGYQVVLARNGREAIAQAKAISPDLILMDIQMPEMDGLEAIHYLRARPEFVATPIIALTALAMPGDRDRCLAAGASEYITKPVSLNELTKIMSQLFTKGTLVASAPK